MSHSLPHPNLLRPPLSLSMSLYILSLAFFLLSSSSLPLSLPLHCANFLYLHYLCLSVDYNKYQRTVHASIFLAQIILWKFEDEGLPCRNCSTAYDENLNLFLQSVPAAPCVTVRVHCHRDLWWYGGPGPYAHPVQYLPYGSAEFPLRWADVQHGVWLLDVHLMGNECDGM